MARGYRTREHQRELVAQWRASGCSRAAFCAQVGISSVTLTRWLARNPAPMTFAEVLPPELEPPRRSPSVIVVLPRGARLVVKPGASMSLVAELARVLG